MDSFYEWEMNTPKEDYEFEKEYYKDQRFYKKTSSR